MISHGKARAYLKGWEVHGVQPSPPEIFRFFWNSEGKEVERKKNEKRCGVSIKLVPVNIFLLGIEIFWSRVEIFSGGVKKFSGGLRSFRGGGVEKFSGEG